MKSFAEFFNAFIKNASSKTIYSIYGQEKTIKGMSLMTSEHYQTTIGNYYKVVFSDDSLLIVIPDEQSIQYADHELGEISSIPDEEVGEKEIIKYNGNSYKLENKHDYQFVLQKIVGGLLDIEGECMFSDYVNIDDSNDSLSLGWISYDGRRADVNSHTLSIEDINIKS